MPSLTPTKRAEFGCDGCGHNTLIELVPRETEIDGPMPCGNPDCAMEYDVTFLVTRTTETAREVAEAAEAAARKAAAKAEAATKAKKGS